MNNHKNTALITGSAHRIGREMAIFLAKNNYDIVIHYYNSKDSAIELANYLHKDFAVRTAVIDGDLSDSNSLKKIADFMINNFPSWNLLINNASIFHRSNFLDNLDDEFAKNMAIHLNAPVYLSNFFAQNVIKNNNNVLIAY